MAYENIMKILNHLIAFSIISLSGCSTHTKYFDAPQSVTTINWKGEMYLARDRIQVLEFAGTLKPIDTGVPIAIKCMGGETGLLLKGVPRKLQNRASKNEPIQVALILWDTQNWLGVDKQVYSLGQFESSIHVSYLKVIDSNEP
jgi:hypothetical protein